MVRKKTKEITPDLRMKYEIATELDLLDKVMKFGWGGLTAKETGRIGGIMTARKKKKK
ncbi:small, acid-soluble spore protein, alpha/beta type [Serpentinicella sp. ANB-PHB4]|uniref:small, acid-soluble spore protein, alpha/beta type n=1 Tax=Serpentinicella sp. ANB-PHB4 TaxID=3074076 RepID=UPI0028542AB9|nr:small, acid-soluble spore protein, alpha/beta type [Serpentinicella sp. ANB-PHB4]MDR5659565.1 small, acid-soluble spore protein, alpha/beta type [Serpentinicella sp. ANB-PHB4]